jgi:hypothetical protein
MLDTAGRPTVEHADPQRSEPVKSVFSGVRADRGEVRAARDGDDIVDPADVVMDRGFTVPGEPVGVWPWLEQLGKRRAGWYLPRSIERFVPRSRRAVRHVDPAWLGLHVGDVIPDYGGRDETFEVAMIRAPHVLVYRSQRGRTAVSWAITLTPVAGSQTRIHLRLRLAAVRHRRLAETAGELIDALTVAGLAAGLRERLAAS